MLDLDLITNQSIQIRINKADIELKQPSFALAKKVRAYERNIINLTEEEINKQQEDILLEFLNTNSNNVKFKSEDIDKLTFTAIRALYKKLIDSIIGAETDPN